MKIEIKILNKEFYQSSVQLADDSTSYKLPSYATLGSAAIDLVCTKDYTIYPGERVMIGTGLAIWIGSGDETTLGLAKENGWGVGGVIIPRSGLGTKGLVLANTVGLIDEDYKSELKISAWNSNCRREITLYHEDRIELKAGDRIAQMYFAPVIKAEWQIMDEFTDPEVTHQGFGSTGD